MTTKETRERAVREAQTICDELVPGKVRVYDYYCDEANKWYLVGSYQSYMKLGEKQEVTAMVTDWREEMDSHFKALPTGRAMYSLIGMFTEFFKQRSVWMNASYYWKKEACQNDIHPAIFKQWRDGYKRTSSDIISYLD